MCYALIRPATTKFDRNDERKITTKTPFPSTRRDWLVPTLLILLSAVPVAAGTVPGPTRRRCPDHA